MGGATSEGGPMIDRWLDEAAPALLGGLVVAVLVLALAEGVARWMVGR